MEIVKFNYKEQQISFDLTDSENNLMVNATEMAKISNKEVSGFLKTDQTEKFIKAYCQTEDIPFGDEFSPNGKLIKIIKGDPSVNGTWMHRVVALKFAAWLDPFLEVWVYKTIDKVVFGEYRRLIEALKESQFLKAEIRKVTIKLRYNEDYQYLQTLKSKKSKVVKSVVTFDKNLRLIGF